MYMCWSLLFIFRNQAQQFWYHFVGSSGMVSEKKGAMKHMEEERRLLSRLYIAWFGTFEDILVVADLKMAHEKASQRVFVVKAITDWYEEQKKKEDGGLAAYLIINECLGP